MGSRGLRPAWSARAAIVALVMALGAAGCATAQPGRSPSSASDDADGAGGARSLALEARLPRGFSSTAPTLLPLGSFYFNPASGRREVVRGSLAKTAVLIGDSQSEPADSWVRKGLERAGYTVYFAGRGGTGFSVGTAAAHDYADALRLGDWFIPYGTPALVVLQGGGNDATRGAADAAIIAGVRSLLAEVRASYPQSTTVVVGTLAKSAADGGGRRTQVDTLLGRTSAELGLPFIACGDWISRYGLAGELADGVHLNPAGKARLAPIFAQVLAAKGLALG
ncbi:SGNH/GDSL hydrolase family protein [Sinomonas sp. ASV322]|uniref:SGNH/GDSL hydrolase family protein n=1 Tax=Sinomonas sp. ASV322 TaxID=3041920 RepID=UPI0027DD9271|nr:SGNH/GDSL hydrolase family protein [Sinomonas sp. ASV322]MDQ4501991.1 SGNH/GDSL hydrolase family protein [Sinomonas sp. ASV322]